MKLKSKIDIEKRIYRFIFSSAKINSEESIFPYTLRDYSVIVLSYILSCKTGKMYFLSDPKGDALTA
jgi:hypothetical protein